LKNLGIFPGFILASLLVACSGDKDNSEPPALLTTIEDPLSLEVNWKVDTRASSNSAAFRLRPLLVENRIFSIDTSGSIRSIDAGTGKQFWKFDSGLSAITGLGGNENIIIATSSDGDVVAYSPGEEGLELVWKTVINSEVRATPVVAGDQVFVRSVDGKLRSLAVNDGSQQWMVSRRVPVLSLTGNSEPLVVGELVFAGFDDGKLVAFDRKDGQIAWETTVSPASGRTEVERLVDLDGRFVFQDGIIFISSFRGKLAAIQAVSGDLIWSREFSSYQPIEIDQNAIYLSADDSHIWAIDKRTGTAFWKQEVLHARKITAPSLIDGKLVVGDFDGYLHWFSRDDGKLLGRIRPTEARNYIQPLAWQKSALALDKDGLLFSVATQEF
jgi:outer membrane protein assembly factor BamB